MRVNRLALSFLALVIAQAPSSSNSKVSRYELDVTFNPNRAFMNAVAIVSFDSISAPSDTAVFYIHGELGVDSLFVEGRRCELNQQSVFYYDDYSLIANRVAFRLGAARASQITVFYSGFFNPSKARSPSDYMRIDKGGVFLRAYGYSPWFPIFLESNSDSYETNFNDVTLRVPADYNPIFAGNRLSEEVIGGTRVSRWRAYIDLGEAQCTARRFEVAAEGNLFVYHLDDTISNTVSGEILEFVRNLTNNFRGKYRQNVLSDQMHIMEMPSYGDISSGNVIGFSEGIWQNFKTNEWSKRGLAHELVHSFVQTDTRRGDSLYAFEIEGFPSYFHLPILAELFGEDWYKRVMKRTEDEYLKKRQTGLGWRDMPLPTEKPMSRLTADDVGTYKDVFVLDDRALLFLNWLYDNMGRDRFFKFTRELFAKEQVTFQSFKLTILKYLPSSQNDIDLWLCSTDYPQRFHIRAN